MNLPTKEDYKYWLAPMCAKNLNGTLSNEEWITPVLEEKIDSFERFLNEWEEENLTKNI